MDKFHTLEQQYYDLRKNIKTVEYITPINLQSEKIKFIEYYKVKQIYNPYFEYVDNDYCKYVKQLEDFKHLFSKSEHPFSKLYIDKIE
jgi:hypothetical protein